MAKRDFIQSTITSLKKEEFDELVRIFQNDYWKYEVVNVDGTNDGGCDFKIFINKRECKKCVQVTVQAKIDAKIKSDLKKVSKKILDYGYSNKFEFYWSKIISDDKIDEYKKYAIDEYDIDLEIYDARKLSQLRCKGVTEYIYSLHKGAVVKPEDINIDKTTKFLYDLLANGKDTTDIKNSLLESVIISILFEKAPIEISILKTELEHRLGKNLPDILHVVNSLKTDHRVEKYQGDTNTLILSDEEKENVQDIAANSIKIEKCFISAFSVILKKYSIDYSDNHFEELKRLYKSNYSNDIDDNIASNGNDNRKIFESYRKYLERIIPEEKDTDSLINEIRILCDSNSFINRICASESFISLYKSNQLEQYLNQKHKYIYLDTPAFVYLLCTFYGIDKHDWDNPMYRSMKSLYRLQHTHSDKISFYVMEDYLSEVAGEIKKGIQISRFSKYPFFKDLGETRNSLYNYYLYLYQNELFELEDNIDSFEDFIISLGFENTEINNVGFIDETVFRLNELAEDFGVTVIKRPSYERFLEIRTMYEKLLNKSKSKTAIRNDVNQVVYLGFIENVSDCHIATWDNSIYLLRNKLMDKEVSFHYFYISNPAQLSNRIALENFNIDESALTNAIFAYADKQYDISNKVKSLLELVSPYIIKNGNENKLLRNLSKIRKNQLEVRSSGSGKTNDNTSLPVEDAFQRLIPSEDLIQLDNEIISKFTLFMSSEDNADYILKVIQDIIKIEDQDNYNLSEFFKKVGDVQITVGED